MKKSLTFLCALLLSLSLGAAELPDSKTKAREGALAAVAEAGQNAKGPAGYLTIGGDVVPILAYSVGVSLAVDPTGGGGGASKAQYQDFAIVMEPSAASPKLFLACAQGKHFADARVRIVDEKGATLLEFELEDVLITSFQTGGSSGGSSDALTLAYRNIQYILIGL